MNAGLVAKSFREVRGSLLAFAIGLGVVEGLLSFVFPTLLASYGAQILQMPFVQQIIAALLGASAGDGLSAAMIGSFAWVHPIVLAVLWIAAITLGTRLPAGEIDRGTIDILLGLPASRASFLACDSLVTLSVGMIMALSAAAGNVLGNRLADPHAQISLNLTAATALNLFAVYVAVLGLTYLVSACSASRGRAVGVVAAIVLASFFLNFLAQYWPPARRLGWLSMLEYFRPLQIIQTQAWPVRNILILVIFGAGGWFAALFVFGRRDIRTT